VIVKRLNRYLNTAAFTVPAKTFYLTEKLSARIVF